MPSNKAKRRVTLLAAIVSILNAWQLVVRGLSDAPVNDEPGLRFIFFAMAFVLFAIGVASLVLFFGWRRWGTVESKAEQDNVDPQASLSSFLESGSEHPSKHQADQEKHKH